MAYESKKHECDRLIQNSDGDKKRLRQREKDIEALESALTDLKQLMEDEF